MDPAVITLVVMAVTAVLLLFEVFPPAITAIMCCLSLTLTGILKPAEAFSQFANINIILFAAMFILGHAFFKCGLANDIGKSIQRFADSEKKFLLALLIVSGGLSMFLSNTSTSAIFLPLVIGLAASTGYSQSKLLYAMIASVGMGGCVTFLGGPGWLFTKAQIEKALPGTTVSMFEVGKVTLPLFVITVIYMMVVGYRLTPERKANIDGDVAATAAAAGTAPVWHKKFVGIVMIVTILAMLFSSYIGVDVAVTGVIAAIVIVLFGIMSETEAYKAISWRTLFLFGGILPLSTALDRTGAGNMVADFILGMMGGTTNPYVITAVCMLVPCVLTQFLSNNTAMTIFTPLGVSLAARIGANPTAVIMAISIGAGLAFATPIGQPGNAMIYGPSGLKFIDYAKPGVPLTVILYAVSVVMIPNVWPFF